MTFQDFHDPYNPVLTLYFDSSLFLTMEACVDQTGVIKLAHLFLTGESHKVDSVAAPLTRHSPFVFATY